LSRGGCGGRRSARKPLRRTTLEWELPARHATVLAVRSRFRRLATRLPCRRIHTATRTVRSTRPATSRRPTMISFIPALPEDKSLWQTDCCTLSVLRTSEHTYSHSRIERKELRSLSAGHFVQTEKHHKLRDFALDIPVFGNTLPQAHLLDFLTFHLWLQLPYHDTPAHSQGIFWKDTVFMYIRNSTNVEQNYLMIT
jgi:hypothetical protein